MGTSNCNHCFDNNGVCVWCYQHKLAFTQCGSCVELRAKLAAAEEELVKLRAELKLLYILG